MTGAMLTSLAFSRAPFHGQEEQGDQEEQARAKTQKKGRFPSAAGILPEPSPVNRQMQEQQSEEGISEPCVHVAPLVAIQLEDGQPAPSAGSRWETEGEQKPCPGERAGIEPERKIQDAPRERFEEWVHGVAAWGMPRASNLASTNRTWRSSAQAEAISAGVRCSATDGSAPRWVAKSPVGSCQVLMAAR